MAHTRRRRRGRRRREGFVAIPFSDQNNLGALADGAAIVDAILTFGEDIFLISADVTVSARDGTAGQAPIEVGLCHGDLSATEVQECLDAELTDPDDIIAKERARRPVRRVGLIQTPTDEVLNNGVVQRIKLKFSVGDGHPLNWFASNRSGAPLTSGCVVGFHGILYGRWQR